MHFWAKSKKLHILRVERSYHFSTHPSRYPVHVYVSASRKLRLQCAAVYCLSWLFSPQLPVPRFLSSSSSFSFFLLSVTYYLPVGEDPPFFLERDAESSPSSPMVYLGDGNGEDFLFPLVWRGWQFRGVSHRGAASRTNKTLERRRTAGEKGPRKLGWGEGENVRSFCGKASRPPCVTACVIAIVFPGLGKLLLKSNSLPLLATLEKATRYHY